METAFGTVIVTISLVAAVIAFLTYLRVGALYRQIGGPSPELSPVLDNGAEERRVEPSQPDE